MKGRSDSEGKPGTIDILLNKKAIEYFKREESETFCFLCKKQKLLYKYFFIYNTIVLSHTVQ